MGSRKHFKVAIFSSTCYEQPPCDTEKLALSQVAAHRRFICIGEWPNCLPYLGSDSRLQWLLIAGSTVDTMVLWIGQAVQSSKIIDIGPMLINNCILN